MNGPHNLYQFAKLVWPRLVQAGVTCEHWDLKAPDLNGNPRRATIAELAPWIWAHTEDLGPEWDRARRSCINSQIKNLHWALRYAAMGHTPTPEF